MISNRFHQGQGCRHLRLRVESCVNTILDLHRKLGEGKIKPEIIEHFEKLKESLSYVTDDTVDETDIYRIEQATNQLLDEIRITFGDEKIGLIFDERPH